MIRLVFSIFLLASIACAAEISEADKLKGIEEEVAKRKKMRGYVLENTGRVFSPISNADSWFKEEIDLTIKDEAIGVCAQTFATLAKKEVFVSNRVMKRRLSIAAGRVDGDKALAAFREAIDAQGIAIVPVGTSILVLVEATELTNNNKG